MHTRNYYFEAGFILYPARREKSHLQIHVHLAPSILSHILCLPLACVSPTALKLGWVTNFDMRDGVDELKYSN